MSVQAIELLHEMVAIPSLSGQEKELAAFLVRAMKTRGLLAFVDDAGNAVGERTVLDAAGDVQREIVLLGHMDTVPGDIPVRIEDGILHGRGAVDAKGPLAAFVAAAASAELRPGTRLIVIGAVEEESATSRGARFAARKYKPDYCVIGEPSGWDAVTLGYKGRILFDYAYAREMGHTAGPQIEVAETAVSWWNQIAAFTTAFNEADQKLFMQLMPSLRGISTTSDGLTNRVHAQVGVRLPPDFDVETFIGRVLEWAGPGEVTHYGYEPAVRVSRGSSLARIFGRALVQMGKKPRFKLKTGTADMNVVAPIWHCPIVAYGPGDSRLDHTPHEQILLEEYLQAIELLTTVLGML